MNAWKHIGGILLGSVAFASVSNANVGGTVFLDTNHNGTLDAGELGVAGVVVSAYDNSGLVASSPATGANGQYTIVLGAGPVRLETSSIPAYLTPGPHSASYGPTSQFVANGATTANISLVDPLSYTQANPKIITPLHSSGDPLLGGTAAGHRSIVSIDYTASGASPTVTTHAIASQTGSVWGQALQRETSSLFSAAFLKRHSGLGPAGIGGIYLTDMSSGVPNATEYVDLELLGIDCGAGDIGARGLPSGTGTSSVDAAAFLQVGKIGLGDMQISPDGTKLYVVNLKEKTLIRINIGNPAKAAGTITAGDIAEFPIPDPGCSNGQFRPFGLGYNAGLVYVGVVCPGDGAGATTADLNANVYTFDAATEAFVPTPVFTMSLVYDKGMVHNLISNAICKNWQTWANDWGDLEFSTSAGTPAIPRTCRTQPLLSDIVFNNAGQMILGYTDRNGHITGRAQQSNDPTNFPGVYNGYVGGDILVAYRNGAGAWTLEQDGVVDAVPGAGANNGQGPSTGTSSGEFYSGEFYLTTHFETSQGSLVNYTLGNDVVATLMDPINVWSGGYGWNDAANGSRTQTVQLYDSIADAGATYGKANGLGALTLLSDPAPIEIGNYVWRDTDGDGIQDPGEPALSTVAVELWADTNGDDTADTQVGSTTTSGTGYYYFGGAADAGMTGGNSVLPFTAYEVRVSTTQGSLSGLIPTAADVGGNAGTADQRDSDGVTGLVANYAVAALTTGASGDNDHDRDFGFSQQLVAIGNIVWSDDGSGGGTRNNGVRDGTEAGIDGVSVQLYRTGVDPLGSPFQTTTTSGGGFYLFDALPEDDYFVHIPASNFSGALSGMNSSTGAGGDDTNDDNVDENGLDALVSGGVSSVSIGLTANTQPTSEAGAGTYPGALDDNNVNLTVDFGFVPPIQYDLGDLPDTGTGTAGNNYQTLLSDSGARHQLGTGLILGAAVDAEADGQPNSGATGDDTNPPTNDDEDGVTFPVLTAGATASVSVTVAGAPSGAQVDAFFDWNDDGDFADAGEVIPQLAVNNGVNALSVPVPIGAVVSSDIGVRVRLSSAGGLTSTGDAPNGEVEDYMVRIAPAYDLGDLPDTGAGTGPGNYQTLNSDSGPVHQLGSGLILGATVDNEVDGQPNGTATGDGADEDGVTFPSLVAGSSASVDITVAGAPGGARVNAFFDWNADGDFADPGEAIPELLVNNGANTLTVPVPLGAVPGTDLGVRVRVSTLGGLSSIGDALDGEVEDYLVQVSPVFDFGDLPDTGTGTGPGNYATQAPDFGPSHRLGSGLLLGAIVDDETDGQPTANADGDDTTGASDDEDGVVIPALTAGQVAVLQITVAGAPAVAPAFLSGYFDWNADGDFADPGEALPALPVGNGVTPWPILVPLGANTDDPIGMRFRLSLQGTVSPTGMAPNGEVEDYLVTVAPVYDFGDNPSTFATVLADDGARHRIVPGIQLGASVDPDADGQPTSGADGDDVNPANVDDEDGVVFLDPLIPGQPARVQVTASTNGFLNAWVDFNGNGSFDFPDDRVIANEGVVPGVNTFTFTVPGGAITGSTYSRFRFTTDSEGGGDPAGLAPDGEVEDHPVAILSVDLGDLPTAAQSGFATTYPTTFADGGAVHQIVPGLFLGALVDAETNGVPSVGADGDDLAGSPNDEDGVFFVDPIIPGQPLGIEVTASTNGFLNAWIDWNGDGVLGGPGEQIATDLALVSGSNLLNVSVPAVLGATDLYSRFRFTAGQGEADIPTGFAPNGEVEDYVTPVADLEFGDLPDVYGTLFAGGGAAHIAQKGVYLGATLDVEPDGQPTAGADGDDVSGAPDDEDGVTFVSAIAGGTTAQVDVSASTNGFLYAWFDFNGDGDFDDLGEMVFADQALVPGVNNLSYPVPLNVADSVYIRFRFTTGRGEADTPAGLAPNGEVEDYVQPGVNYDLGDLPDSRDTAIYPTYLNHGGARHQIVDGVYLGARVDAEGDGQPTTGADGDDINPPTADDEDGLFVTDYLVPGYTTDIEVTASTNGFLNAWFDFNNDGDIADPGEQVFVDLPLVPGVNTLALPVPAAAAPGDLYSRLRFTTAPQQATAPTGTAPNGEVEDYLLAISPPVNLGNLVWRDANNNGAVDPGETGIDGVIVELHTTVGPPGPGNLVATDTTSGGGLYNFDNLYPGTYVVYIPTPPADAPRSSEPTGIVDNGVNNDDNGTQASTGAPTTSPVIQLNPAAEPAAGVDGDPENGDLTVDFGFYEPMSLGNRVWFDADNSGAINGAEAGIDGVTVQLYLSSQSPGVDVPLDSVTTAGGGYYLFDNLTPGDYVIFIPAANFTGVLSSHVSSTTTEMTPNSDGDANDNGIDDAAPAVNGIRSGLVTLAPDGEPAGETDIGPQVNGLADANSSNLTVDFGFYIPVALGNVVFFDRNNNGIYEPGLGESGINGVNLGLFRTGDDPLVDAPVLTTTTAGGGFYVFDNLTPGAYFVHAAPAEFGAAAALNGYRNSSGGGLNETTDDNGDENGLDNAAYLTAGIRTIDYTLTAGTEPTAEAGAGGYTGVLPDNSVNFTADLGFYRPVNLGNLVWNDANNDGVLSMSETGIDGVLVRLFDASQVPGVDSPIAETTTSGGGFYNFNNLQPGQYLVYIPTPPASAPRSSDLTDVNDNQQDSDDNGTQAATGNPVSSPVITLVSDLEPSGDGDGPDGDLTVDFGFYQPVNLGNLVWNDANNNGVVDPGEAPIPGVTVELYLGGQTPGSIGPTATDVTDGSGLYNFDDLRPGDYIVSVPTPPAAFPRSSDVTDIADNGEDGDDNGTQASTGARTNSPVITLLAGTEPAVGVDGDGTAGDLTVDFGFYQPVNLGNLVWNDLNNNGVVDPGEPGIPGVTVELYHGGETPGSNLPFATQSTGGGGLYNFTDLPPGDYLVSIPTPPPGAPKSSTTTDPADNGQDNDDNGAQPGGTGTRTTSPVITLLSPTEPDAGVDGDGTAGDLTVDFGFFQPVNLGDLVWHDRDGDGFKDVAETGIPDVTVELYLATQTPGTDSPVATDVTDPNGLYNFDDLSPGQYVVYIPVAPPATPASSPATDTADNGQDLDDNGSQPGGTGTPVTSPVITLLAGTEPVIGEDGDGTNGDLTVDFGFYTPVRVGDLVWNDLDGDGVQDSGEPGVTNVVVTLVNNTTSAVVSNLTTGVNGEYLFSDLPPGDYFVTFELPPGYLYTVPNSTNATDSTDSDAGVYQTGGVASTPPTGFLFSGQEDITLDAGAYEPATLGDTVWIDVTRDGDPSNENLAALGIPGVTVDLLRVLEGVTNVVGSTSTSTNLTNRGYYVFTNLPPGSYVVRVDTNTVPAGYPEPTTVTEYLTVLASGDDSQVEDFGFITETTAIDLKSLAASEVPGGVRVAWETSSEKDNFGFLVYRSDRLNGARTLVSPALIEGQGTGSGSSYAFLDAGVDPGRYFYWLEDLDYDGTRTIHGPAVVVVDGTSSAAASAGLVPVFVAGAANVAVDGVTVPSVEVEGGLVVVTTAGAGVTAAEGEPVRLTAAAAAPVEGVAAAATLADGNVAVVSAKAGTNLLVGGFTAAPVAVLVSAEGSIVLEGAVLETDAGFGLYLSVPADGEVVLFAK